MLNVANAGMAGFGKIFFVAKNHTTPALPDMNLIVLEDSGTFQAICIDVEIDALGNSLKDACKNLKRALQVYTTQMVENYGGNIKAAAEDIINVAFSEGELKSQLFTKYLQAKHQYLITRIAKKRKAKSRREELVNALRKIFQFEPVLLNLIPVVAPA
jgi:predicted RNase H-like HicB family nuclease